MDTSAPPGEMPEGRTAEVRLGLVMYGGVSLAVYMNGAAQEFYNAVRGRGVYRLLKHLVDADVTIDVISGTSAGGINAILLGYALANEREFASCSQMWREFGAFKGLLHGPFDGPVQSLLDTRGYLVPHLVDALCEMGPIDDPGEDASKVEELDVFITGTDFDGEQYVELDESGHAIQVKEHRAIFRLKHRADRLESSDLLTPAGADGDVRREALAKLGAITSALPVAFEPVTVAGMPAAGETAVAGGDPDWYLRRWGRLRTRKYFIDGGVLANKPLMPAIDAIAGRGSDREVERHLCYVDPDPDRFGSGTSPGPPSAAIAAATALTSLQWYESIASDLQAVSNRNSAIERFNRLWETALRKRLASGRQPVDAWHISDSVYRAARLMAVADGVVASVLSPSFPAEPNARRQASALVSAFDRWASRADEEQAAGVLLAFDVDFRRRRLAHAVHAVEHTMFFAPPLEDERLREEYQTALAGLSRSLQAFDIVDNAVARCLDELNFHWTSVTDDEPDGRAAEVWSRVRRVLMTVLAADESSRPPDLRDYCPDALAVLNRDLTARIEAIKEKGVPEHVTTGANLLEALDRHELQVIQHLPEDDPVRRAYEEFAAVDGQVLPLELAAGLQHRRRSPSQYAQVGVPIVKVSRFSPDDTKIAFSAAAKKVQGTRLAWFGAFMKDSWRANDILWGRLDAAAELVKMVLNNEAYRRVYASRRRARGFVTRRVAADPVCRASNLFPTSDLDVMYRAVQALTAGDWNDRNIELLIEAAQREIIAEEMKGDMPTNDGTHPLTPAEFFAAYRVPSEGWLSVVRPGTITLAAQTAAVLASMGIGLWWRGRPDQE